MTIRYSLAYSFPNGFQKEAQNMMGWLNFERLNPKFRYRSVKGNMNLQILLPRKEIISLRNLQVINPARYGNPPKPYARLIPKPEGYKVIPPNGRALQPYMRKLEAKRYCKLQGWEWIIYK